MDASSNIRIFVEGPISPDFIASIIRNQEAKKDLGAHHIFLGQVRRDPADGMHISSIDYSSYQAMAEETLHKMREETVERYKLSSLQLYHSLGTVKAGEISLFVMASSGHRENTFEAVESIVNRIKKEVPIWKKEFFEDESYRWVEPLTTEKPTVG